MASSRNPSTPGLIGLRSGRFPPLTSGTLPPRRSSRRRSMLGRLKASTSRSNGGSHWSAASAGLLAGTWVNLIAIAPTPSVLYASVMTMPPGAGPYDFRLYRSLDAGGELDGHLAAANRERRVADCRPAGCASGLRRPRRGRRPRSQNDGRRRELDACDVLPDPELRVRSRTGRHDVRGVQQRRHALRRWRRELGEPVSERPKPLFRQRDRARRRRSSYRAARRRGLRNQANDDRARSGAIAHGTRIPLRRNKCGLRGERN